MKEMNLSQLLAFRERGGSRKLQMNDDSLLHKHSMEIGLSKLQCSLNDEYPCTKLSESEFEDSDVPPFVGKFAKANEFRHILAVASEEGEIFILNTNLCGSRSFLSNFKAHDNAIFDMCWVNDTRKLVTVSGDRTAALWDVTTSKRIASFYGHTASVKSVAFRPQDQSVFATGSRDGNICIWDYRHDQHNADKPCCADNIIRNVHQLPVAASSTSRHKKQIKINPLDRYQSVTVVLFQDDYNLISAGVGDGIIKIWDLRKTYCRFKNDPLPKATLTYAGRSVKDLGYSSLDLDSGGCRLFANCTDNVIYEYNCASLDPNPVATYSGHQNSTYYVKSKLSPDDNYLLSGSSDNYAYIWKVGHSGKPLFRLSGHSAEVTSVDWCLNSEPKIVTCSDDMRYRIWRMHLPGDVEHNANGKLEKINGMTENKENCCRPVVNRPCSSSPSFNSPSISNPLREIQTCNAMRSDETFSSPTQNLPNTVLDELQTPESNKKNTLGRKVPRPRKVDWLTGHAVNSTSHKPAQRNSVSSQKRKRPIKSRSERANINKCLERYFT